MMRTSRFSTLPILAALLLGLALQGLNVFDFHQRSLGTVDVGHLAGEKPAAELRAPEQQTALGAFADRLLLRFGDERGEIAAELLNPVAGIKALTQRGADLLNAMKAAQAQMGDAKLTAEARTAAKADFEQLRPLFDANNTDLKAAQWLADEERKFPVVQADPDAEATARAARAAGVLHPRVEVTDRSKERGFFGAQLQAIQRIAAAGGVPNAAKSDIDMVRPMMAGGTGMTTDVGADGGFLVSQERSSTIIQRAYTQGALLSRITALPIGAGSNGMKFPAIDETSRADSSRFGGIVSGWLGQGGTLSAGKPKLREIDLKLRKVGAFLYATDEQLADAVALEGWVNRYLPLELAFRTEDSVINGTGANQPQGIVNSGALISVTRNTASRVLYEDISAMWARMWAGSRGMAGDASKTCWLVDQSVEPQLEQLTIPLGTAGVLAPIYKPAGSVPGQVYATLYGRPVIPVEYCAALGTTGDIILVDFDQYLLIDKGSVDQAVSIHVQFLADESVFRFIYRVDGQLSWNSALTPKSAGDTLSCALRLTT